MELGLYGSLINSCAAFTYVTVHHIQQTKEALQKQLDSEARERELTYMTIATSVELSDGQQGFTESEWTQLAQRITSVPGSSYADAQSFLAAHPFGSLQGPDGTISDEETGQILLKL